MRQIEFRQWNKSSEKWHYWGYLGEGFTAPIYGDSYQYTGLKDKNGVKIFEGDKVKVTQAENVIYDSINVIYSERWASYMLVGANDLSWYEQRFYIFEVIGNIHENGELL